MSGFQGSAGVGDRREVSVAFKAQHENPHAIGSALCLDVSMLPPLW